ncbi:MAG: hypothetical protein A2Y15_03265 [Clostridiales bacterium GWF2_36_10]|nr:MAG: hypothetical protein A2Y15_03265 [Clostridiales bacterium GWF2_36_10]HAN20162.1 hypothetical protein [Clostridiales bacterium]
MQNSFSKKNNKNNLPPSRPPQIEPTYCKGKNKYEPSELKPLLNTYIYIWLSNGSSFWMYPVKLADNMVCGYTWSGESWEMLYISCALIKSLY